ncbi:MAG: endonuclease III [Candidatus Eisenbacteria bacterium]|uniref:Endonuclease III n=1 Tax=Eiseniibacteriota bacterium TaxID=2212470 RepID=A0A948RW52_UNCEI|nr:endonuclease III [Candidatus Eisenbacteria bacterium]MBU1948418.1 endonuclease III [Candidatus Eisenbacteria bacterium]MBU2692135.1 endonuclease III [Candidatus Eisenbacteria bacterium]
MTPKGSAWVPTPPSPAEKKRALRLHRVLAKAYPDTRCFLNFTNPWELLVATILSAQCTDARVNMVTPNLFKELPSVEKAAKVNPARLEKLIHSTGFYKNKSKSIKGAAQQLIERFDGKMPETLEELVTLPGVGRKTANVILGNAFGIPGITVDTHVRRVSQRLDFTKETDPDRIEQDLMLRIPQKEWTDFSHRTILHGRTVCDSRKPKCEDCPLLRDCPYPQSHP